MLFVYVGLGDGRRPCCWFYDNRELKEMFLTGRMLSIVYGDSAQLLSV